MDAASKEIIVDEALAKLTHFARLYGIRSLFIVGGFCRNKFFDHLDQVNDINVASAFEDQAMQLAGLFASEILHTTPKMYKKSGAGVVNYETDLGAIKIEFQGQSVAPYMHNQEVRNWLHASSIDDVPLMHNIFGRDFTINALILSLHDGVIYDPTDLAAPDLEKKRIASLLPPEMLIKYNPLAILRAIRFAMRYNFSIDPPLRTKMKKGATILAKSISQERITKEIVRILKIDSVDGLEMLQKYNLTQFIMNSEIKKYLDGEEDD